MKENIKLIAGVILLTMAMGAHAKNSVLSSGDWYKISVSQTGVHQITYDDLVSYGIDPGQIDPQQIRLYGNGNGMLPEANDEFRYDDLQENAIYVYGGDDGVFDPGDYVLFYGEGPTKWKLNEETGLFGHQVNLYSDFTFYFLNFDLGLGKRIEPQNLSTAAPTYTSFAMNDYFYHEPELENLIHSGKEWVGDCFDNVLEYAYEIEFPNIVSTAPVNIATSVLARSTLSNHFGFEVNGQEILSLGVATVSGASYSDYAKTNTGSVDFLVDTDVLDLSIVYDKPNDTAVGWLDYFTLNASRLTVFENGQMRFRDVGSIGEGKVTQFQVTTNNSNIDIWNITNPINPASIDYAYTDGKAKFTLETDSLLEFIAFDNSMFYSPGFVGVIENQNLHALDNVDMIIVSHEGFLEQAEELADFREAHDGLSVFVVTPEKIYNEFSSGAQDITAIRDFLKYLYEKSSGEYPKYLLLFGDASYDYKNTADSEYNYVPVWESQASLNEVISYCTDDFFSGFDGYMPEIGTGRLPVKTVQEANAVVEKIIHYSSSEAAYGNWRNEISLIADDGDGNLHFGDTEELAEILDENDRVFNLSKIYLDAYELQSTPDGNFYPEVNQAITDKINDGTLIVNYVGHGSYYGLAQEEVFTWDDLDDWANFDFYPLFIAATSDFVHFDDPDRYSIGEESVLMEGHGMSAVISPSRATYAGGNKKLNQDFYYTIIDKPEYGLGELLGIAKQMANTGQNGEKWTLLGDPSMRLAIPGNIIVTEAVNGVAATEPLDTLNPGEHIIATGFLADSDGEPIYNFNGPMKVKVYERARIDSTLGNDPSSYVETFLVRDSVMAGFETEIINGQFVFDFQLPYELSPEYGTIKLSYYAKDGLHDARGHFSDIVVGGQQSAIDEHALTEEFIGFYPTIVSHQLNYSAKQDVENLKIEIFDLSGKMVFSKLRDKILKGEQNEINVSSLQKGMYLLRAYSDDKVNNMKFVKQ